MMMSEKTKKRTAYWLSAVLLAAVIASLFAFLINDTFSLTAPDGEVTLDFSSPSGVKETAIQLKSAGLIKSSLWFRLYAGLRGKSLDVQPGIYTLRRTVGYDGFLRSLGAVNK